MIPLVYAVKKLDKSYTTKRKIFKSAEAKSNYEKDLMVRGTKITGIQILTLLLSIWDWETFFKFHPDYIHDGSWHNAVKLAKKNYYDQPLFQQLIADKEFEKARSFYYQNLI